MKKTVNLILCTVLFVIQSALAEKCLETGSIIAESNSDEEASERLSEFKESVEKYFSIMGEEEVPGQISWDEARNLVRFLSGEGFEVRLLQGEDDPWVRNSLGFGGAALSAVAGFWLVLAGFDIAGPRPRRFLRFFGGSLFVFAGVKALLNSSDVWDYIATDDCYLDVMVRRGRRRAGILASVTH